MGIGQRTAPSGVRQTDDTKLIRYESISAGKAAEKELLEGYFGGGVG